MPPRRGGRNVGGHAMVDGIAPAGGAYSSMVPGDTQIVATVALNIEDLDGFDGADVRDFFCLG